MVLDKSTGSGGDRWLRDFEGGGRDLMWVRKSEEGEIHEGMRRRVLRSI